MGVGRVGKVPAVRRRSVLVIADVDSGSMRSCHELRVGARNDSLNSVVLVFESSGQG